MCKTLLLTFILTIALCAVTECPAQGAPSLEALGAELKAERLLTVGTPTHSRCPGDLAIFAGLKMQNLTTTLGTPDYVGRNDGGWSYFFTSPIPFGQHGGGFPELTFFFNANGIVTNATCYLSK